MQSLPVTSKSMECSFMNYSLSYNEEGIVDKPTTHRKAMENEIISVPLHGNGISLFTVPYPCSFIQIRTCQAQAGLQCPVEVLLELEARSIRDLHWSRVWCTKIPQTYKSSSTMSPHRNGGKLWLYLTCTFCSGRSQRGARGS